MDIEKEIVLLNPKKAGTSQDILKKKEKRKKKRKIKKKRNRVKLCFEKLTQIFNSTEICCEFPNHLKKVDVTSVFKKDDPTKAKATDQ